MASNPITMKRDGSGSLAQKLLAINPPPGYVYGSAYSGLGDDSGNPNPSTIAAGIVIFSVIEGVTVYDRDHPRGQSFGSWCANHGITGEEYNRLSNAVQSATPPYLTACVPVFAPRCVLCSGPGGNLIIRGKSLLCRVGHVWEIHRFTIPEIPPSIEAEVYLTETKHDYFNILSVYAERPSMRGSNEAGELVDYVEMGYASPWPADKHRAVVVGTMKGDPSGTANDWTGYILPTDEDGDAGAKFAGTVTSMEATLWSPDEERLSELDDIHRNQNDIASLDPTGGELIPPPTVGNPWRVGLYYKGGKLVMARPGEAYGRGVSPDTQVPNSRLVALGGFELRRDMWPGGDYVPPSVYPDAQTTYSAEGGETKVATLAAGPTALDVYAYFFETVGWTVIEQMPWREMRCVAESGNGRASSSASVACVAFYAGSYWGDIEVKINGADPKSGVQIETIGGIVTISVPLSDYWTKSGTNKWSSGQTLNIVARWRGHDDFFAVANAAFNDVPLPSVPDPASVDFDEFRQWDFGSPSAQ